MWETIQSFDGFTQFILVCCVYYLLKFTFFVLPNRVLRTIRIWVWGWPPSHLDADGDFKRD